MLKQINQEIQDFQSKQIHIVPGLSFNQYDTINQIYFYHNSQYISGAIDDEGEKKYFYNINRNPCKVFSKAIDFDTKNIRLLTAGGQDGSKTWFMERDLKYWMRDKQFGKTLNRLFKELPVYGTVVLKVVDGTPEFVDLRNFIVEQTADNLQLANYVTEIHKYTPTDFREAAKGMNWKQSDIDEVISLYYDMDDTSHIRLYERYGDVKDENTGEHTYRRVFWADVGVDEYNQMGDLISNHPGVELGSDEWTERLPYWEFHADKTPGRWLGIGVVEELFEPQIAQNQNTNLQNKSSFWAALRIFQTRDGAVNRNLMTDVRNGEIMNVESEITPINMDDRNLAFFNQQDQKWMRNRDELTFSYDVVQGERLPAGTPLGSAQLASAQTLSYFEQIQESVAMDVKEMLYEAIIPYFQKSNTSEHTIRLVGKDLADYIDMHKKDLVNKEVIRQAIKGNFVDAEGKKVIEIGVMAEAKQNKEFQLTIPKDFYKNVKYDVDIDITGESIDTRVRNATLFAALQAITTDPTVTQDPVKKGILSMMLEDGGVNPAEIFDAEEVSPEDAMAQAMPEQRGGGGVSAPAAVGNTGQGQQTI